MTTSDLGASRFGPIPLLAMRLAAEDRVTSPTSDSFVLNPFHWEKVPPKFVLDFEENIDKPRYPVLIGVSLTTLSPVIYD